MQLDNDPLKREQAAPASSSKEDPKTSLISRVMQYIRRIFGNSLKDETTTPPQDFKTKEIKDSTTPKPQYTKIDLDSDHSIIYNVQTKQYTYISPPPDVKNLVISGGGAKGIILPGVIKAFEEYVTKTGLSFRQQIEHVAGSSAGAITASLFAVGLPADDLINMAKTENLEELLGKGIGPFMKSGKPLLNLIRKNLQTSVKSNLKSFFNVDDLSKVEKSTITAKLQLAGKSGNENKELTDKIFTVLTEVNKPTIDFKLTFSMLQSLHKMDPKTFKSLTVTSTCRETGKTFYFDAENTPDLDISVACRASASIPGLLTPVKIEGKYLGKLAQGQSLSFSDGGYLDNIPLSIMENKQGDTSLNKGEHGQNLQTLALVFDEKAREKDTQSPFLDAHNKKHTLYDSRKTGDWFVRDIFLRIIGGINTKERNTVAKEKRLEEVREKYTQRSIPLHITLSTTAFKQAMLNAKKYIDAGYLQGAEYINLHENELMAQSFDTLDELLTHVPNAIKEKATSEIEMLKQKTQNSKDS